MFGTEKSQKFTKKVKKSGSILKDNKNKPGSVVSVDQIRPDQKLLFLQLSGKLTITRIWSTQVMVDHFSDLNYVHLTRITIQEEILAGKTALEIWAATFWS